MLTLERLKTSLAYTKETGAFTWLYAANYYTVGREAGNIDSQGYRRISIDGKLYKAHRLAWMYVTGAMPTSEIDHINGVRHDNRIDNLRPADRHINTQNISMKRGNSSGLTGVSFYKPTGKWKAQIRNGKATRHLGYYETPEAAHLVYVSAKQRLHPGFARAIEAALGIGAPKTGEAP